MYTTNSVTWVWLQFGVCALVIAFAGSKLSRYGDIIADKTGLSRNWIGVILLATVTSLPELVTGISSVTIAAVPDIAVGNVLGACMVNLFVLVAVDLLYREESFYRRASRGHILSAGFGIVLLGVTGLSILLAGKIPPLALGHVGLYALLLVVLYALAVRSVMVYEKTEIRDYAEDVADRYPEVKLREAVIGYALAAVGVVAAGIALPFIGTRLAEVMGWHGTFVGTLFVSIATTLPELAVTISALRLGALDMAIGNLLGSNLFNIFILAVDDLFYLPGPLLSAVSPIHAITALSAMVMSAIAVIGLLFRPAKRVLSVVGWTSLGLSSVYILTIYVHFRYGE